MGLIADAAREITFLIRIVRTLRRMRGVKPSGRLTAADIIESFAQKTPDKTAILFEDKSYSYADYDRWTNRYAHWGQRHGLRQGDVVALLMENRPEFLFTWGGMAKLGVVTALLNTNLTGSALAHAVRISGARHLILGAELAESYSGAVDLLEEKPQLWASGGPVQGAIDLDAELAALSDAPLPPDTRASLRTHDNLFYIYTSGTTGNPKAANFSHFRFIQVANAFSELSRARASDRMYVVLPLYHSAGGACAVGSVLVVGGTVVLRRRFSASGFWEDVHRYRVTLFQYIGELCRYLLNAPVSPFEADHTIRLAIGNGLRPDIWLPFKTRFKIPEIVEFYGATEGNVAMANTDGTVGAVGRIPSYLDRAFNIKIVRYDVETETHPRGPDGFMIACADNEAGEAIGKIPNDPDATSGRFEGYRSEDETRRKILRDVFEKGDAWFRSGDLMRRDKHGYFYFVDRIGDTFRWKGENVATSEVAEVLSVFPGITEATVYGVKVEGCDGRAGMAAIVTRDIDLAALSDHLTRHLAPYAIPLFLRLRSDIEITGTFKHRKVDYVREGYDPDQIPEPLYFRDPATQQYIPLTTTLYRRITTGEVRV